MKKCGKKIPFLPRPIAFFGLALLPALLVAGESGWNTRWTSHFLIHQENTRSAKWIGAEMEKIFRCLRKELWTLSSWMDTEKVEVYLYKDRNSYLEGRFKPPAWSGGIVYNCGRRGAQWSLAVYEPFCPRTVAHELTHLYFASFFKRAPARIPLWLNEGLAEMMVEETAGRVKSSYRPHVNEPLPAAVFLKLKKIPDPDSVQDFYSQAHSVVRFLKKANSPFKFEKFCRQLRDGEDVERALFSAYGFGSAEQFEKTWKKWAAPSGSGK
ncbi:MAG: hypothetical protein HY796_01360 [Elusimicrobia bacterium]|nr:hypothetical protein [Elusimicrobiota bacterium]